MRRPNSGVMCLDLLININIGFSSIAGILLSFECNGVISYYSK
jgi:hypothetical protein